MNTIGVRIKHNKIRSNNFNIKVKIFLSLILICSFISLMANNNLALNAVGTKYNDDIASKLIINEEDFDVKNNKQKEIQKKNKYRYKCMGECIELVKDDDWKYDNSQIEICECEDSEGYDSDYSDIEIDCDLNCQESKERLDCDTEIIETEISDEYLYSDNITCDTENMEDESNIIIEDNLEDTDIIEYSDTVKCLNYNETYRYLASEEELYWFYKIVDCEVSDGWGYDRQSIYESKLRVAQVILNRVESSKFPNNIIDNIFAENQFSPVDAGALYDRVPSELTIQACNDALLSYTPDYTYGALYFMSGGVYYLSWATYLFTDDVGHSFFI